MNSAGRRKRKLTNWPDQWDRLASRRPPDWLVRLINPSGAGSALGQAQALSLSEIGCGPSPGIGEQTGRTSNRSPLCPRVIAARSC